MITFFRLRPFFFNDCVLFFFANREHEKIDAFDMVSCTFSGLKSSVESAEREEICDRKSLKSFFFFGELFMTMTAKTQHKKSKEFTAINENVSNEKLWALHLLLHHSNEKYTNEILCCYSIK